MFHGLHCRRLAAWAGMVGPALFVAIFTLEGWFRPDYEPLSMFVSELSLGPRGWIQSVNFVVLGLLFLAFTCGVAAELDYGTSPWPGPVLLTIIGVGFLASGIFTMDPLTVPPEQLTWHGKVHTLFGAVVFSLMPVSCLAFLRRFRGDPRWRSFRRWTLAAAAITAASVVVMSIRRAQSPEAPHVINEWIGAVQRTAIVTYLGWQFAFARRLRKGRANEPGILRS